jgi:branched-chain amino acid aminotransferase
MNEPGFPFSEVKTVWMNGEQVPFADARVHVLTHALHYGSGAFEGMRCYDGPAGPAVFRLEDHVRRLLDSCQSVRMDPPFGQEELAAAVVETLRANDLRAAYVRPLVYRGFASMYMDPRRCPIEVLVAAWPTRGRFMGEGSDVEGIDACVSSWRRAPPDVLPLTAKLTANYASAQLITMEAAENGYGEGIALDTEGNVSEGAAMNLFMVHRGELLTPPLESAILPGITRDSILRIARDLSGGEALPVHERKIPRGLLYTCDELFLTGTSAEVTPVRSVDRIPVGDGKPGPVTRRLMKRFEAIAHGEAEDPYGWRTEVYAEEAVPAE